MYFKKYILIFIIFTYSLSATTFRDLIMMRMAVFGNIITFAYHVIESDNKDTENAILEEFSMLYFKGNEFAPHSFLKDDRLSLSGETHYVVENNYFTLTNNIEFSVMRWNSYSHEITNKSKANLSGFIYSLTPMFRYHFKKFPSSKLKPFFELGVGGSIIDNIIVEERNKSTQFQFNDNIGMGFEYGRYIFGYRFIHYSNLNIKTPNPSIDLHHIYFGFKF